MTPRERLIGLLRGATSDRLPFFHVDHQFVRGECERDARNRGTGIICYRPCYVESIANVEIVTKTEPGTLVRTYHTPVGSATEVLKTGIGYGIAGFNRDWMGIQPRRKEFLVRKSEDYRVLKFIVENIHYKPYYSHIIDQIKSLGGDGIIVADMPYEPLQRLLIEWIDWRQFYGDFIKNRKAIDEIYEILENRYEEELFPIAASSPSEVIRYGGNIDSVLVSPTMFENYYLPSYAKVDEMLRTTDKFLDVHMDGRLNRLAKLIGKSRIKIVEAFTPPPMGDLPIREALSLWKDKVVWINFPATISTLVGVSPMTVKKYLVELLESLIPGNRTMLIASTENRIPEENLTAMAEVMEKCTLPLSEEVLFGIRSRFVDIPEHANT